MYHQKKTNQNRRKNLKNYHKRRLMVYKYMLYFNINIIINIVIIIIIKL